MFKQEALRRSPRASIELIKDEFLTNLSGRSHAERLSLLPDGRHVDSCR
jgi:hypothetical protein